MIIALIIAAWGLCAVITYGVIGHLYPDDSEDMDDKITGLFLCVIMWPLFVALMIGICILKKLVRLGEFVTGFLDSVHMGRQDD